MILIKVEEIHGWKKSCNEILQKSVSSESLFTLDPLMGLTLADINTKGFLTIAIKIEQPYHIPPQVSFKKIKKGRKHQ